MKVKWKRHTRSGTVGKRALEIPREAQSAGVPAKETNVSSEL